jgi:uncharacterized membrane protein
MKRTDERSWWWCKGYLPLLILVVRRTGREDNMKKTGWLMTAFFALFMLGGSAAPKLLGVKVATESMTNIGWPIQHLFLIGVIEVACTVLFVIPRRAFIGAVPILFG